MKRNLLLLISLILTINLVMAQKSSEQIRTKHDIVCYAKETSQGTRILPPKAFRDKNNAKTQASNFVVTYNGFTQEAQDAFQVAVDIWASLISSPVTIHIDATWEALDQGVLGSAGWGTALRNFEGAKEPDTWYPIALAEKMAGKDLNDIENPDIVARFNSNAAWYLGTDGNPGSNQYDFVSVVLHEIGHGLGFVDSFDFNNGNGSFGLGTGFPFVYDIRVDNTAKESIVENFLSNSDAALLGDELTSNSLFFSSPTAIKVVNEKPKLWAPADWSPGSSIAHLDENIYIAGDENSLMTPQIGQDEVMQDPGPITLNMFGDMGWEYTYITHTPLTNREDFNAASFQILASVQSDIEYKADSVILHYSLDEFVSDTTSVFMTGTANPDEFTADIPSTNVEGQTYSYFINVPDSNSRSFSRPSLAPTAFYTFTTKEDTEAPEIIHENPAVVRNDKDALILNATIKDFLDLASAEAEYFINDQTAQTVAFMPIGESDTLFQASIDLTGVSLQEGDSIKYRITAVDQASTSNTTIFPSSGLLKVDVIALPPAVEKYSNDFNDVTSAAQDFFTSDNFRIETISGFDNGAIHSDHPYLDGTGANSESNYTFELGIPILLKEKGSIITFDEVVLVEPGDAGTQFGDQEFWDYVIVEGSNDGGQTWEPFLNGYDSRANADWLSTYNGSISGNNSEGTGDASLFRTRSFDMLENTSFIAGEEILIRFRLFADAAAHGWGWAIDNLKIQIDEKAPTILHDHLDFITDNNGDLAISATVLDLFGVDSVAFVTFFNETEQPLFGLPGNSTGVYETQIKIDALSVGDVIKYQIVAFDNADTPNVSYLPSETEFFEVPFIEFNQPVDVYTNDFNTASDDFVGNFFNISQPAGFSNGLINSANPYPSGFGLDSTSIFTFTLKTPIIIDDISHYMGFEEVLLTSPNDMVAIEASADNGLTWTILEEYSSSSNADWQNAVNNGADGTSELLFERSINLKESGDFATGDEILIRFRLTSASAAQAWGWAIDNLEIQTDQVTSLPSSLSNLTIQFFPNPVEDSEINLRIESGGAIDNGSLNMINSNGQSIFSKELSVTNGNYEEKINIGNIPAGIYLIKINLNGQSIIRKIIKTN